MTLEEAIEEVKECSRGDDYYEEDIIDPEWMAETTVAAIVTVLNAVTKGELTHSTPRQERHESKLAEEKALSDRLAASYAMSLNDKAKVKACPSLTAYRKARGL